MKNDIKRCSHVTRQGQNTKKVMYSETVWQGKDKNKSRQDRVIHKEAIQQTMAPNS